MDLPDRFTVDDGNAFWRGLRVPDTAAIAALAGVWSPGGAGADPIDGLADWAIGGEPLVWQAPDHTSAFVNGRYFGDLAVVDATALSEPVEIGIAKPALLNAWPPERIIRFLLVSGIVRTFAHSHAELALRKRVTGTVRHVETYDATHVYFTNEENRVTYGFALSLTLGSGRIEAMPM